MKIKQVLVVINPIAGGTDKNNLEAEITNQLREQGQHVVFCKTTGHSDEEKLRQAIASTKPDVVVAAGGDGTVHLAARALSQTNIPLAIIPLGSGNGLSKDLGIPQSVPAAIKVLQDPLVSAIDTLLINKQLCVHVMDLGFNALVVKRFDEAPTRGPGTYIKTALQEYLNFTPKQFRITSDGGDFSGEAFMITVTNANQFGSNATVNPNGILNDGLFEICIIEPFPKTAGLGILYQLYNETIDRSAYTRIIRCSEAILHNPENELMQIDGEPISSEKQITVKLQSRSLRVLLPTRPENLI